MNPDKKAYQALEILHSIAKKLNGALDLEAALQTSLQEAVSLLNLQTGWIWLLHPNTNSVFLAASYNLPPAFTKHPERLSGWCYCIEKYLGNQMETAVNISEITCTRLKDLEEGTNGLRFHASVPLYNKDRYDKDQKIGLLNVVSEASGQVTENQLNLLHHIGEMLSVAIQRTQQYEKSKEIGVLQERKRLVEQLQNSLLYPLEDLMKNINEALELNTSTQNKEALESLLKELRQLGAVNLKELEATTQPIAPPESIQYPLSPLTKRELEVLQLLKEGKTNKAIASELFISERTVKFHVSILLNKLDAKNRTEAVQIALKRGIVKL